MINFMSTWLGHSCPDIWLDIISGSVCEGVFFKKLDFELVDWVNQILSYWFSFSGER